VGDLSEVYLEGVERNGAIKASTKEYRAKTIKYLFRSWQGLKEMAPAKISETECRHWAAEYRAKFSETLFNNTLDSLRHLFNLAIERGFIAHNPAAGVEKVRVPQKKLELPSRDQFHAILGEVRGAGSGHSAGNGDLIEFLAYSGLRATGASLVPPMPYFLRIQGGIGMHAGYLPGYPASHGCIRLPKEMAVHFFQNAPIGTPVAIHQESTRDYASDSSAGDRYSPLTSIMER
jgi:hypothetical protein